MTAKADFTPEDWKTVLEGPPTAGMIVIMAAKGGTFKETFAIGKAYAAAREQHGGSELIDEIVAAKPHVDHTHYHSYEELKQHGLQHLGAAITVLSGKASAAEVDDYRRFVVMLAETVAKAHREDGVDVSPPEQAALDEITASMNAPAA